MGSNFLSEKLNHKKVMSGSILMHVLHMLPNMPSITLRITSARPPMSTSDGDSPTVERTRSPWLRSPYNSPRMKLHFRRNPSSLLSLTKSPERFPRLRRLYPSLSGRKMNRSKQYEYEVKYAGSTVENGDFLDIKVLKKMGWEKAIKAVDLKLAQLAGIQVKPLSAKNVEKHLNGCGLAPEFGTHYRMSALSGGQKVKVVIAAAMWMQPHIVILDEPTNYLDRESLGGLAHAIETFDGGVIIISHNNEFVSELCPETWVMDSGHLETKGDADWMLNQDTKINDQQQLTDVTDAAGNKVVAEKGMAKKMSKKEEKVLVKRIKAKIKNGEELDTDEEELAFETDLL